MSLNSNKVFTTHNRKELGDAGEQLVISHLQKENYTILDQNYAKRFGEVDIIARKNNVVAFVEVKLRQNPYFQISQVITLSKQKKIIQAAKAFVFERKLYNLTYRFDVALVTVHEKHPDLMYIENAFTERTEI